MGAPLTFRWGVGPGEGIADIAHSMAVKCNDPGRCAGSSNIVALLRWPE